LFDRADFDLISNPGGAFFGDLALLQLTLQCQARVFNIEGLLVGFAGSSVRIKRGSPNKNLVLQFHPVLA
jgi:hypothetical protein